MKIKTINLALQKKFDAVVASITDERTAELVKKNTIISGGCITSMLLREPVNDYDIYFRDAETALAVARYYCDIKGPHVMASAVNGRISISVLGSANESVAGVVPDEDTDAEPVIEEAEKKGNVAPFTPVFLNSNAISLSGKVQMIIRFYGDPLEIHKNYDFVHCTNYWTPQEGLVTRKDALEAILSKELRYIGSLYPVCSVIRTRKFLNRGWTINAGQYLKMCWQVSKLDLTNIEVLKDQLVGVDSLYFLHVIGELQKEGGEIEGSRLFDIIDAIF